MKALVVRRFASVLAIFVLLLLQLGTGPACRVAMRACCCKPVPADATICKASCCAQPAGTRVLVRADVVNATTTKLVALHGATRLDLSPRGVKAVLVVVDRQPPPGIGCGPPYRLRV
ncbi:MAG: hypothetical protein ABI321_12695 [Polyangia bacterium]